jgi:hypothetical protein
MSFTFKDIETLVQKRINTYSNEPDFFKAAYDNEKKLIAEYNGRQLLELLQNCDDAGAESVEIVWDRNKKTLTISNSGTPFSIEGIESLMLANSSPKSGKSFIGNKGLGFRSILNWANHINIFTNGCQISFSETIAKTVFEEELKITDEQRKEIRNKLNLIDTAIPFPTLAIPDVKITKHNNWATSIEIEYDISYEKKIEDQLNQICEEILLFLNHITNLRIEVDGADVKDFSCIKTEKQNIDEHCQHVNIGNKSWLVFSSGEIMLPEKYQDKTKQEKEHYNLKIAFQDDLSDDYGKFFNFFPTKQSVNLPCLIHGTLEINNSRDYFVDSDKNDYIIEQFPDLFETCVSHIKKKGANWDAFRFLTPTKDHSDSKEIRRFYTLLENLKSTLEVFPTVKGKYVASSEMVYYNDELSEFVKDHYSDEMPKMVLPLHSDVFSIDTQRYSDDFFKEILEELPDTITIKERAQLIYFLAEDGTAPVSSLLIDKNEAPISVDDTCFTPSKRLQEDYKVPQYAKISLLNSDLYNELISLYINDLDTKERDRDLVRKINSVVNIRPYDSAAILELILSKTQSELNRNPDSSESIIKVMVQCLFYNYINADAERRKSDVVSSKVKLLNEHGVPTFTTDLFLSKTYPKGKFTEEIFGNIYENKYLLPLDNWQLDCEHQQAEDFFQWLGVNKFVKFEQVNLSNNLEEWKYFKVASGLGKLKIPDGYCANRVYNTSLKKIKDFNIVQKLPISKLVLLCHLDEQIKAEIEKRQIEIKWFYSKQQPSTYSDCSYVRYQLISSERFSHILVENGIKEIDLLINGEQIDFNYLAEFGLPSVLVKSMLLQLGAKETVNQLSPQQLYAILLKVQDKEIKGIQTIYKAIADALDGQNADATIPEDLKLYARVNSKLELLSPDKIYYSNNSVLPQKVLDSLPILYFPKRAGEDKAAKYFGVNIIKKSKLQIDNSSLKYADGLNEKFQTLYEALKPYILLYRLYSSNLRREVVTKEAIRQAVLSIKRCQIHLVSNCRYQYESSEASSLENFDFISNDNIFFIAVSNLDDLKQLTLNSAFSDSFAEIMSILFEVNELKNDFRFLIRNDLKDTKHLVIQDFSEEKLSYVRKELGISQVEYLFWKQIFEAKQLDFPETLNSLKQLQNTVEGTLNLILPNYYRLVDFVKCSNKQTFDFLNLCISELKLDIKTIYPQGIIDWHYERMINTRADYESIFKSALWSHLKANKEQQSQFLEKIDIYKRSHISEIVDIPFKYVLEPNYVLILKQWVESNVGIELTNNQLHPFKEENYYTQLFQQYNFVVNQIEDDKIISLLYFEENVDIIETYLKEQCTAVTPTKIDETSGVTPSVIELIDAELQIGSTPAPSSNPTSKKGKRKRRKTHSAKSDEAKTLKGKESEILVLKKFKELYGDENVKWVSGYSNTVDRDDNLQHDIEYRNNDETWIHVEVKTLNNESFILSAKEKEYALKNSNKYEFALVNGKKIYRIYNPFNFKDGDSFESNKAFRAEPNDYTLKFNIRNITR